MGEQDEVKHSLNGLVRECLRGSSEAFRALDQEMRSRLIGSLQNRGASYALAEEIAADLLSDCSLPGERSLLNRFEGKGEFRGWLLRVAINRLIDRQRRRVLIREQYPDEEIAVPIIDEAPPDRALRDIVRSALKKAFVACDPQVRVLLWLTFAFGVKQCRLADAWGWSEAKISRKLSLGCDVIREQTLSIIQTLEPGLTLEWDDVIGVCAEMKAGSFFH